MTKRPIALAGSLLLLAVRAIAADALGVYRGDLQHAPDHKAAEKMFRQAASGGDARAAFTLSEMLRTGDGVAKNRAESAKWLLRSATAGDRDALLDVALLGRASRLPPNVVSSLAFSEVRDFARHGQPFSAHEPGPDHCLLNGTFRGVVHFFMNRIVIDVDRATVEHLDFMHEPAELRSITAEITEEPSSPSIHLAVAAASAALPVGHSFSAARETWVSPRTLRFTIVRSPITPLSGGRLTFRIEGRRPSGEPLWCYVTTFPNLLFADVNNTGD